MKYGENKENFIYSFSLPSFLTKFKHFDFPSFIYKIYEISFDLHTHSYLYIKIHINIGSSKKENLLFVNLKQNAQGLY